MTPLLEYKNTMVYGGGGSIGGGVAWTFAREGARVLLAGRTREPLEAVAAEIAIFDSTLFPAFGLPPLYTAQRP